MGRSIHHPLGLIYKDELSLYDGFVLFSSIGGNFTVLVDVDGNEVHRWENSDGITYGYLLHNGNLLCRTNPPKENEFVKDVGGSSNKLIELDRNSKVVWEYENPMIHHDFIRLENGETYVLVFDVLGEDFTSKVLGGYIEEDSKYILGDSIIKISKNGEIIEKIQIYDHLDFNEDVICPLESRKEWTHANSLSLTFDNNFLLSFRSIHTVGILSSQNQGFLWKWGPGETWHQHHPTQLPNNNILLFDNGSHSKSLEHSRVIEINPFKNEIVWQYAGSPPNSFYSFHVSSAQRLPNGNTLICEGAHGRIFEVTETKEIVWEYVNPFFVKSLRGDVEMNQVFRAHKYSYSDESIKNLFK